jgi:hypothetical protein
MSRADKIAAALGSTRREGRGWRTCCPIHGGYSLVVADGRDGRLLLRCWGGGCDARDILAEIHRRGLLDNTPHDPRHPATRARIDADDRNDPARWIRLGRRRVLYRVSDVEEWLRAHTYNHRADELTRDLAIVTE